MSAKAKTRGWEQTMSAEAGGLGGGAVGVGGAGGGGGGGAGGASRGTRKRSTRTAVVSKAMRVVDEETRRQVRDLRLEALEADNFTELGGEGGDQDDDDEYVDDGGDEDYDDDLDGRGLGGAAARQAAKRARQGARKPSVKAGGRWAKRRVKSLAQHLFEEGVAHDPEGRESGPNHASAAARPSIMPARKFCSVCGYFGKYSCTRCGLRYCSLRCHRTHKETRCLKFAL